MNSIRESTAQPHNQRPTVRLRQDWERHVSSDEDEGPMTPISDNQGQIYVKQQRKSRKGPGGKLADPRHQMSSPKSQHEFRSELENLFSTRSAELEQLDAPRTYSAKSSQPSPQRLQNPRTHSHDFINYTPHRTPTLFGDGFIARIVGWTLTLLGTILTLLQYPIAIIITVMIAYWGAQMAFASLPFASVSLCGYPVISSLELCQTSSPGTPHLPPRVKEGLDYTSKLEEMQTLGAYSADLPHLLSMGEGGVRGMIVQLSVVDLPTRQVLHPDKDYRVIKADTATQK